MSHTSNGHGPAHLTPRPPLVAKSLRGLKPRRAKAEPPSSLARALPPIQTHEPESRKPRSQKRAKVSERPAIPAEVADLISFAQAYPSPADPKASPAASPAREPVLEPLKEAARVLRTSNGHDVLPKYATPQVVAAPPSGSLQQNPAAFREAYSESFREALESYHENVPEAETPDTVALVSGKLWRSCVDAGPEVIEPETVAQVAESAQAEETSASGLSGPPASSHLGGSVRGAFRRVAGLVTAPFRGLRLAWAWYQGRRVLQSSTRRMHVAETISLGEKRFLSVVEIDDCLFLVGGGASSVAVLAQLGTQQSARDLMNRTAAEAQA